MKMNRLDMACMCGIVLFSLALLGACVEMYPTTADSLIGLSIGSRSLVDNLTSIDAENRPTYRPLLAAVLWAQYKLFGVEAKWYFLSTITIWGTMGCGLFLMARIAGACRLSAFILALLLISDFRAIANVCYINGFGLPLACTLGCLGFSCISNPAAVNDRNAVQSKQSICIAILLLTAAAFSKEHGLAFLLALAGWAFFSRSKSEQRLFVTSLALITLVVVAHLIVTRGISYQDDMGFGREVRCVSYASMSNIGIASQYAWNVFATFIGILFPHAISHKGSFQINWTIFGWIETILILGLTCVALRKAITDWLFNPSYRNIEYSIFLLLATALISFMLYRPRNHLPGLIGLYTLAAVGLSHLIARGGAIRFAILVALLFSVLGYKIVSIEKHVIESVMPYEPQAVYRQVRRFPNTISREVADLVVEFYGKERNNEP